MQILLPVFPVFSYAFLFANYHLIYMPYFMFKRDKNSTRSLSLYFCLSSICCETWQILAGGIKYILHKWMEFHIKIRSKSFINSAAQWTVRGRGGIGVCYSYEWIYEKCRALWNVFHCDLLIVSNSRAKLLTGIRSKMKVEFIFSHGFCCCCCQAGKIIVQVMRGKKIWLALVDSIWNTVHFLLECFGQSFVHSAH